jgi:hypothetical protein
MPRVGFETTIPGFERAKTVRVLDRPAIVIGKQFALQGVKIRLVGPQDIVTCYATKDAVRIGNPFITKFSLVTTIIHN